ncbi:MAG: selenide, water dikinase SelD [Spirochaetes bacterium]|nr:selenide, water dikinase SelD [Spirochaetota bacterium]MBN2770765.1 selenide, water dikinase SelD [Spirochaetota bacterium]
MDYPEFDLLTTVETGGCSAKLPAGALKELLAGIPQLKSEKLIIGNDCSDDALVFKINDSTALIQTTDFFPPLCSDPYTFGYIAAVNALSDVFAMGGEALTALNIVMFPTASIDKSVLKSILTGGADAAAEAGAVLAGGHTIDGPVPVYGLSVTGSVHPDRIMRNSGAKPGDLLILTKAIGTGALTAALRTGEIVAEDYSDALFSMKQLNMVASRILQEFDVCAATDITGFSLAGHALEMALASKVHLKMYSEEIPLLDNAYRVTETGCIPCASFRNLKFVEDRVQFSDKVDYNRKMLSVDAQTSGGLLVSINADKATELNKALLAAGYDYSTIIGEVFESGYGNTPIEVV